MASHFILDQLITLYFQPTPRVIGGGQSYLMILPERDGNHGYWKHIALISTQVSCDVVIHVIKGAEMFAFTSTSSLTPTFLGTLPMS